MEGPVGRAGRASFVLLPAPLAAAPAPPLPRRRRAPHFRFEPLEEMGAQRIWGVGLKKEGVGLREQT